MEVRYSKAAIAALKRSNKRRLIAEKIELLARDPAAMARNVTQLVGQNEQRLRVQDWRVIFYWDNGDLVVRDIAPRGSVYED